MTPIKHTGPVQGPEEPEKTDVAKTYDQTTLPTELSSTKSMPPPGPYPEEIKAVIQASALAGCKWPES
jgi:hypothetical protein